jgi:DNA adenine methylase
MRPPIQYFGSKGDIAEQIVALMPPHKGYIEPYAGSLAVLLAKPKAKIEVANDLDERLITFWRVLRDRGEELIERAMLTPHSREELERAAALDRVTDLTAMDELEVARQVWVLLTQGRSRTMKRTGWRFYADPNGTSASFQTYMTAYRNRLTPAMERLLDVSLECRPALEVIEKYGAHDENLLYVDPPYLGTTRRGGRYSHEMPAEVDHRALAEALHRCASIVFVSGYPSALYDELYRDWHQVLISASSGNSTEQSRTEVIWANRPIGNYLFDNLDELEMSEMSGGVWVMSFDLLLVVLNLGGVRR